MKDILKGITYIGIFAVPFVVLLVTGSMFFPYITGKNFAFRILVEIMFAAWLGLALLDARYRPKFSWMLAGMLGLLVVMFFANLFGEYPLKSFWSNYERMEGYVTLVHFFLYFLVAGAMMTAEKHWRWLFNTTLAVAALVCVYAFAQISGSIEISQGGTWRVDSTLGNSTYMAVYMLFHIFIAAMLFVWTRSQNLRYLYGGLIALFVFILFQTGTRGAVLGLTGGILLTTLYLALFAHGHKAVRKIALAGLITLAVVIGGFMLLRETAFVQNSPMLDRLADISLESGSIRFTVWGMALEGIKERPLLGWGQENFSYVFNEHYRPELYRAEAWYDRTHNLVFDWLIAGGIVGAFFYFSLFAAALWYAVLRPLFARYRGSEDDTFTVTEQALILGLFAAYIFHNLFVFDNTVSYIFFALVLAFIHSRVATDIAWLRQGRIDTAIVERVVLPGIAIAAVVLIYVVNVPPMRAAGALIDAFRTEDLQLQIAAFERAYSYDSFGRQEITEQLVERAISAAGNPTVPNDIKDEYVMFAEEALLHMIEEKPNDPRFHIFLAGLYRASGGLDRAAEQLARAHELTPGKTDVIIEQGVIALMQGDTAAMQEYFKQAYELAPEYERAQISYASSLFYSGEIEKLFEVVPDDRLATFANQNIVHVAIERNNAFDAVTDLLAGYIAEHPESVSARAALALLQYRFENDAAAIVVLETAARDIPSFAGTAACYIENVEDGDEMTAPCVAATPKIQLQ